MADSHAPELAHAVSVLTRTPAVLRALLGDLSQSWLSRFEGGQTFDAKDVLGHLIHGEETDWIPRVRHILQFGDSRPFAPFDRRGFTDAAGTDVMVLLDRFDECRRQSLTTLASLSLSQTQMDLRGLHPELGPVTLGQLIATWTVHDLNHISQIVRVMSRRYDEAVGPWKPYLGILKR